MKHQETSPLCSANHRLPVESTNFQSLLVGLQRKPSSPTQQMVVVFALANRLCPSTSCQSFNCLLHSLYIYLISRHATRTHRTIRFCYRIVGQLHFVRTTFTHLAPQLTFILLLTSSLEETESASVDPTFRPSNTRPSRPSTTILFNGF